MRPEIPKRYMRPKMNPVVSRMLPLQGGGQEGRWPGCRGCEEPTGKGDQGRQICRGPQVCQGQAEVRVSHSTCRSISALPAQW